MLSLFDYRMQLQQFVIPLQMCLQVITPFIMLLCYAIHICSLLIIYLDVSRLQAITNSAVSSRCITHSV
jgi:hypothetical protein